jgi:hypothetical protein
MVSIKWLWATKKSSERWLAKNPPEPCRDIIRVGGSLLTVRPAADELVKGAGAPRGRSGDGAGGAVWIAVGDIRLRGTAQRVLMI